MALLHGRALLVLAVLLTVAPPPLGGTSARGGDRVITTDMVPGSGMFHHIAVDDPLRPSHLFAADTARHVIHRKDLKTGSWEVFAGQDGQRGAEDGPAMESLWDSPTSLCLNPLGTLVVADSGNACLRQVSPEGVVSTLAGSCGKPGAVNGPAHEARFSVSVKSIACLANCSVLVGDLGTGRMRAVLVDDPACAAAVRRLQQRKFTTRQVLLLMGGSILGALLLAAAGVAAARSRYKAVQERVAGYRELREALDPAPPTETRRRVFQQRALRSLWALPAGRPLTAKPACPASTSGGPSCPAGSTGTEAEDPAVRAMLRQHGLDALAHPAPAPALASTLASLLDADLSLDALPAGQQHGAGAGSAGALPVGGAARPADVATPGKVQREAGAGPCNGEKLPLIPGAADLMAFAELNPLLAGKKAV